MKKITKPLHNICLLLLICIVNYAKADNIQDNKNSRKENHINRIADSVLNTLSLREKIAQLMVIDFSSTYSAKSKKIQNTLVKDENIGGVLIMRDSMTRAMQRLNEFHAITKTPLLVTIDGEWGVSMRFTEQQPFPRQMQLGALSSDSLIYKMGKAIGEECNKLNIHVNFAPDIDINNNINNPVINIRSFGENREKVAKYGMAYSRGMKAKRVAGSAKHFPGHGDTDTDSHKALPTLPFNMQRLDSLELYPFKKLIADSIDMVMVGHLEVKAIDSLGKPASISKKVITDFLRNKLGFNGIICTDALNMDGVAKMSKLTKAEIPYEAYKAGADILLMPEDVENAITLIEKDIKAKKLSEKDLNLRTTKMLRLKAKCGLFDKNYKSQVSTYKINARIQSSYNDSLIRKIGEHSVTLLTNKNNTLPLKNLSNKKIVVISYGKTPINSRFNQFIQHYTNTDSIIINSKDKHTTIIEQLEKAKQEISNKDLVIIAVNDTDSRPNYNFGIDSSIFSIFAEIASQKPTVMAYMGSPYAYSKIPKTQNYNAFLVCYQVTDFNNLAAVESIFGGIPTLGELPVSTAEFKAGESIILPDKYRMSYPFYKQNVPLGYTDTLELNNTFEFAYLPYIFKLIEADSLKGSMTLGEIFPNRTTNPFLKMSRKERKQNRKIVLIHKMLVKSGHANILLSDLINHRSGLPQIDSSKKINLINISKLQLSHNSTERIYSNANIFYLTEILKKDCSDSYENALTKTKELFTKLEMFNTYIKDNSTIITTRQDIDKLNFAIKNKGYYAGEKVLTSNILNAILTTELF